MNSLVVIVRSCAAGVRLAAQGAGSLERLRRPGLILVAVISLVIAAVRLCPGMVELASPDICADPLQRPAAVTIANVLKLGGC